MTAMFACAICIVACNLVRCSSQDVRREKNPVINRNGKIILVCAPVNDKYYAGNRMKVPLLFELKMHYVIDDQVLTTSGSKKMTRTLIALFLTFTLRPRCTYCVTSSRIYNS